MPELSPHYLLDTLKPDCDSQIVLALSGGLDSMVLLHLLVQARELTPFALQAVYVDHGISAAASTWGDFCLAQCQARQVAFSRQAVLINGRDNLEHKARQARYQALAAFIRSDKHILLTAHHGDDQLESLLLALKRGSGAAGLSGIAARRPFANGSVQRPLLAFNRSALAQYANTEQLQWVEDDSNSNTRFERNFIRLQLAPVINARWPHFAETAARSMQHLAQLQQLTDHYTAQALAQCITDDGLSLSQLAGLVPAQQDLVLRKWLAGFGLNPSTQWLDTLKQQVIAARADATPLLVLADYQLRRFADRLYALPAGDIQPVNGAVLWQGEPRLVLPANCGQLVFSAQPQDTALPLAVTSGQWVFGQLSLSFKPFGAAHSKPLKQWFKLWQVPPWQRLRVPLLLVDGELLAVAGYASSIAPQQATLWLQWQRG